MTLALVAVFTFLLGYNFVNDENFRPDPFVKHTLDF